ncbi:glutathione-disulfide reductase [Sphingomonas sp. BIUV-7]|uniref:Glutathione-disulfide reductase n=1 Tax=Sphingomonas natans TaxID=3063330 RepID=A0ABT8Y948_9SPHN|nr:glutathione-disulfide reductase [Sphingomonas sp. BIUV-7]MDO6414858.1 glutathione-disulfide reductase [Sphingomonas sp. BIUV-7]
MSEFDYDLFVIGAGSGGVRASRVAGAYGAKVAVAEEYRVGGTCVIRGCVPKKMLVYGAHFAEDLTDARRFGWKVPDCEFVWPVLRDNVLEVVKRIEGSYGTTLANNNVQFIGERAVVTGPNSVRVGQTDYTAGKILVATGATPDVPDFPGAEFGITSNEVFELETLPKRIIIAGAGYIANEFAGIFHEFGAHVTLVNRTDVILRQYEQQIRERLLAISIAKGIEFKFHTVMEKIERQEDGTLKVYFAGGFDPVETDMVLFATGRRPNTDGLGLESAGIHLDKRGAIPVDDDSKTVCDSIYAVGDVTNRVQLTPVAIREGQAFADTIFGKKPWRVDYGCIPSAVFSNPPMAGVGLTETEANMKYGNCKTYTADFRPMKNVLADRDERALYKMIVHSETEVVLGLHMIGPDAPEILQAAAIAVKAKLTKQQFDETVALHPSMAEELVLMR